MEDDGILCSFGQFSGHLVFCVNFMFIWYLYISRFGMLYEEKIWRPLSEPGLPDGLF
jgi:hypothetical protein